MDRKCHVESISGQGKWKEGMAGLLSDTGQGFAEKYADNFIYCQQRR
jgi:hypothetical protein